MKEGDSAEGIPSSCLVVVASRPRDYIVIFFFSPVGAIVWLHG